MSCEPVIRFDFDKPTRLPYVIDPPPPPAPQPLPVGYDPRPAGEILTDVVWHSTEHGVGQSFAAVCRYLQLSRAVSVHYAVGPDGEIQRILDPLWRAWGAGLSLYQGRREWNDFAVQIELYHRAGSDPYPAGQLAAARWLARRLVLDHPTITGHVCHRWIAIDANDQYGRKQDPTDFSDTAFRTWITSF